MKLTLVDYNKDGKYSELNYYNKEFDKLLKTLPSNEVVKVQKYLNTNFKEIITLEIGSKTKLLKYTLDFSILNKENTSIYCLNKKYGVLALRTVTKICNYYKDLIEWTYN